jgi:hypothetical protein
MLPQQKPELRTAPFRPAALLLVLAKVGKLAYVLFLFLSIQTRIMFAHPLGETVLSRTRGLSSIDEVTAS